MCMCIIDLHLLAPSAEKVKKQGKDHSEAWITHWQQRGPGQKVCSNKHTKNPYLGILKPFPTKGSQGSLAKWAVPWVAQGKYKMSPEDHVLSERNIFKNDEGISQAHKDKESICRGSHWSDLGQSEHKIINYSNELQTIGEKNWNPWVHIDYK